MSIPQKSEGIKSGAAWTSPTPNWSSQARRSPSRMIVISMRFVLDSSQRRAKRQRNDAVGYWPGGILQFWRLAHCSAYTEPGRWLCNLGWMKPGRCLTGCSHTFCRVACLRRKNWAANTCSTFPTRPQAILHLRQPGYCPGRSLAGERR